MARNEKIILALALAFAAMALSIISANANIAETGCCYNPASDSVCDNDYLVTLQACCGTNEQCLANSGNSYWKSGGCNDVPQCQPGCCCPYDGVSYSPGGIESFQFKCIQTGKRFVQEACSDVCEKFQCSDGIDSSDADDCIDLNDAACADANDNTEDDSPAGCKSTIINCDTATNLQILRVSAEPVTGQQKIRIEWDSDCQGHSSLEGFDVYRCEAAAGAASCSPTTKINNENIPGRTYDDANVEYGKTYTYKVEGRFRTNRIAQANTDTVSMGQRECSEYGNNREFCKENKRRMCREGVLVYPTGLTEATANCGTKRCYSTETGTECRDKDACEISTANPFQSYINSFMECEFLNGVRRECFYDRSYALDSCYQCPSEMKCYDYKSQLSCERHNCHQGENAPPCQWVRMSEEIGTGVCVNPNEYNCEGCEPKKSKVPNYNEIFEACDRLKSSKLSVEKQGEAQKFRCLFVQYPNTELGISKACNEASCLDYKEGECTGSDYCGIGICKFDGGSCVKESNRDADNEPDCNGIGTLDEETRTPGNQPSDERKACEADYLGPETIVVKEPLVGATSSLAITVMDQPNAKDPKVDMTREAGYITYICVENCDDCTDNSNPARSVKCGAGSVQTTLAGADGRRNLAFVGLRLKERGSDTAQTLIKFAREASYNLQIYSSDPSKNIGLPKTESVTVALRTTQPNINYFSVTNSANGENGVSRDGNLYTNRRDPTIKAAFHDIGRNAKVIRAALQQGAGAEIQPTGGILGLTPSATIVNIPFSGLAQNAEYDFKFDAEDEATKTQMDRNDICPKPAGVTSNACPSKIVIDSNVIPTLKIKKGTSTLVDLESAASAANLNPNTILAADVTNPDATNYISTVPITLEFEESYGIEIDRVEITDTKANPTRKIMLYEAKGVAVSNPERITELKSLFTSHQKSSEGNPQKDIIRITGNVRLKEGEYQIVVEAHDFAGNAVSKTVNLAVNAHPIKVYVYDIKEEPSEFVSSSANPTVVLYTDNKADCKYGNKGGAIGYLFTENGAGERFTYTHTIQRFTLADLEEKTIEVVCKDGVYSDIRRDVKILIDTSKPEFRHPDSNFIGFKVLPDYKDGANYVVAYPKQIVVSFKTTKTGKLDPATRQPIPQLTLCKYRINQGAYTDFADGLKNEHSQFIPLPSDRFAELSTGNIEVECRSRALPTTGATKSTITIPFKINAAQDLVVDVISPSSGTCQAESYDADYAKCNTNVKVSTNKKIQCDYTNNIGITIPKRFGDDTDYTAQGGGAYEHSVELKPTEPKDYTFNIKCIDTDGEEKIKEIKYSVIKKQMRIKNVADNRYVTLPLPAVREGVLSGEYQVEYPGLGGQGGVSFIFECDTGVTTTNTCRCDANGVTGVFKIFGMRVGTCTIPVKEAVSERRNVIGTIEAVIGAASSGPLQGNGRITGIVKDTRGNILSDVFITVLADNAASAVQGETRSGSGGTYSIVVPPGDKIVRATKVNYGLNAKPVTVVRDGTHTLNFDLAGGAAPPDARGIIRGTVRDALGHQLQGVTITIFTDDANRDVHGLESTGSNGAYQIEVPIGSKDAEATKTNYLPNSKKVVVNRGDVKTVDFVLDMVGSGVPQQPVQPVALSISRILVNGAPMTGAVGREIINVNTKDPVVSVFFNKDARIKKAELQLGTNTPIAGTITNPVTDANKKVDISFANKNLDDGDYKLILEAEEKDNSESKLAESNPNRRIRIDTITITLAVKAGRNNKIISEDGSTILIGGEGTLDQAAQTARFGFVLEFNKGVILDRVVIAGSLGDIKGRFLTPHTTGKFLNSFTSRPQLALADNPSDTFYALEIAAHDISGNTLQKTLQFKVNAYDFSIMMTNPRYGFAIQNPFQIEIETDNDATCGYLFQPTVNMNVDMAQDNTRLNAVVTPINEKNVKSSGRYNHIIRSFDLANAVSTRYPGVTYEKDRAYKLYVRCEKDSVKKDNLFDIGVIDTTNPFEITKAEFKPAGIYELPYTADLDVATGNRAADVQIASVCKYSLGTEVGYFNTPFSDFYGSIAQPTYTTMAASHKAQVIIPAATANGNYEYNIECRDKGDRVATGTARLVVAANTALSIDQIERKRFKENEAVVLDIKTNKKNFVNCEYRRVQPPIASADIGKKEVEGPLVPKIPSEEDRLNHKYPWGLDTQTRGVLNLRKGVYEFEVICTKS